MKYHPITDPEYFHNRDYLGKNWNRKFVRAIQSVLNATKGKVGRGKSFFETAFGKDEEEFFKILYMPETMIIYRDIHTKNGMIKEWWHEFQKHSDNERVINIIEKNDFSNSILESTDAKYHKLLKYYTIKRESIKKPE